MAKITIQQALTAWDGVVRVDVVFTRKAKGHLKLFYKPVDLHNTKINKYVKSSVN